MISVRKFLDAVAEALAAERGTSSRDLLALQFEKEGGDLRVLVGREPHPAGYPPLENILRMVIETCEQDGITVPQLQRITFFDSEINLECARPEGAAAYTYPIESCTVH
jgi:hypothetical protein